MASTVLVTGGAGYIGSVTVERLVDAGRGVVVLDDLSMGHRESLPDAVPLVVGSVGDAELVASVLREHDVASVIHFAAKSLVGESMQRPGDYYEANVVHGARLLEAMERTGVRRIVFSSSAGVYGEPESVPIGETHPTNPVNVYGATKLAFEKVLKWRAGASGLNYISLRYFNAAGATELRGEDHDPETHLIPIALKVAQGSLPKLTVFGNDYDTPDGTCMRDYIHIVDLAQAHMLALTQSHSGPFNLGNGVGYSVNEVIDTARVVTGHPIPAEIAPRRPGDPDLLVAAARKARDVLGWKPEFDDLRAIIESAWNWHVAKA